MSEREDPRIDPVSQEGVAADGLARAVLLVARVRSIAPLPDVDHEVLLPEQYWPASLHLPSGPARLLWTLLADGLRVYREQVRRGAIRSDELRETEQWIFGPQPTALTSFETLCGIFGIDATQVRDDLLRFRRDARERFRTPG